MEPPEKPDVAQLPQAVRRVLEFKEARRKQLAQLPPEEKLRIIVEMQKWARAAHIATGRPPTPVWNLDELMKRAKPEPPSQV
ncbi:MAG: hypothetical protein KatS3mg016_1590 [Fimbriimonadales bacterium]|nr:MAG: hypothetical protein KatS3mg016_1590 [Fimbriimonadales bacterium]